MHAENNFYGTATVGGKRLPNKEPSKEELKGKNSFLGPDQNRLIDICIKQSARHP